MKDIRRNYGKHELLENDIAAHPFNQFEFWFNEALDNDFYDPNAMTLATALNNKPAARILLLKGLTEKGFVFFSNYLSRKGKELAANPNGALLFFWDKLERQVRVEGIIEKISAAESDEYFHTRPKESRIGAWASPQSNIIESRSLLDDNVARLSRQYANTDKVPRPEHWGGYILIPDYLEFWQGRANRLHDRIAYRLENNKWKISRLAP